MRIPANGKGARRLVAAAVLSGMAMAAPAKADVWVYGNGRTLDVLIYGNSADSEQQMADRAFAITRESWQLLWQGSPDQIGWIAVSCIKRSDGGVHFEFATEQPSKAVADELSRAAAQQFVVRSGGALIAGCGGAVQNTGKTLAELIPHVPTKK